VAGETPAQRKKREASELTVVNEIRAVHGAAPFETHADMLAASVPGASVAPPAPVLDGDIPKRRAADHKAPALVIEVTTSSRKIWRDGAWHEVVDYIAVANNIVSSHSGTFSGFPGKDPTEALTNLVAGITTGIEHKVVRWDGLVLVADE